MPATTLGKIIVVDDDENISSLLSVNLGSEGYDVAVYDNAEEVIGSDLSGVRLIVADAMDCGFTGISQIGRASCRERV